MNIAEILKYCPKGTKLYSTVYGEVELDSVNKDGMISISIPYIKKLFSDGQVFKTGECVLFPSKDQRDWNKFRLPVKRGDIMMSDNRAFIISDEYADAFNNAFHKYICGIDTTGTFKVSQLDTYWTSKFYIPASEEAKKELFNKMAEAGYKWNADTLELEKIESKFKIGDVVIDDQGNLCLVSKIRYDGFMTIVAALYRNNVLNVYTSNTVNRNIQLTTIASTTDRNKLYSALVREGYKYDKEQHLLIKQEFKPFDKVLVRNNTGSIWFPTIFLKYTGGSNFKYLCFNGLAYAQCISYEGNEYLTYTTDSPE